MSASGRGFIVTLLVVATLALGGCSMYAGGSGEPTPGDEVSYQPASPSACPPGACCDEALPMPPGELPEIDPAAMAPAPDIVLGANQLSTVAGTVETIRVQFFEGGAPAVVAAGGFSAVSLAQQVVSVETWSRSSGEQYLRLTAVAPGTATVRVTRANTTADMTVTVLDSVVNKVSLVDDQVALKQNTTRDVGVFFYHATGAWIDAAAFAVSSSNPQVVGAVEASAPSGRSVVRLTGKSPGTATVSVAANGATAHVAVTVVANAVAGIHFSSDNLNIESQCTRTVSLTFRDADQDALVIPAAQMNVSTSDPLVVQTVPVTDGEGNVAGLELTGGNVGSATVTVTAGNVQAQLVATVVSTNGMCWESGEEEEEEEEEEELFLQGEVEEPYFYFSYDDSASTAAVEVVKHMLKRGELPPPYLARVWEFLNYERLSRGCPTDLGLFDVSMGMVRRPAPAASEQGGEASFDYLLGTYVASPTLANSARPDLVLTVLVDISGSMSAQIPITADEQPIDRVELVKYGLYSMLDSLRQGDVVNLVSFDSDAQIEVEGALATPGETMFPNLQWGTAGLYLGGSTNLDAGIGLAYRVARRHYDPNKQNRVVILTDAYANTGTVDPNVIAENVVIGDREGIYFSGLGVGEDFNDPFLNALTDVGKGAYFSLVTRRDARRALTERFTALMSVAARDVRFRLDYPGEMSHVVTASEESSTDPDDVQPTNFSFNTSQYFFEVFNAPASLNAAEETFKLTAYYTDPATGQERTEMIERSVAEITGRHRTNLVAAELIYLLNQLVAQTMTPEEVAAVIDTHPGLSAPLIDEYKALIDDYAALSP